MNWLIKNYELLQGIYVIATILLTLIMAWTSIRNHIATKSFNEYEKKLDFNKTKSSISSIYYDLIFNISQAFKILRYIEKEKKIPSDIHIIIMDNWADNVSNINSVLNYKEIYEINILYKKIITIHYLLDEKKFDGLKVELENLKLILINEHLKEYFWIDFSMRYEYMFNLKYLSLFHRMYLLLKDVKYKEIVDFIDSSVSKQINYIYDNELIIEGEIYNGILKNGRLLIKNDNMNECINIHFNENGDDHIIIFADTEKLVDADYIKENNQYQGFKTVYTDESIHFQGKLEGDRYINGYLYEKDKYEFNGEIKNGLPYNGDIRFIKKGTFTEINRIFNFEGVFKNGYPYTGKGGIFHDSSREDVSYYYCADLEEEMKRHIEEQEYYDDNYKDTVKEDLIEQGKEWIDIKRVEWKDGEIIKDGSIITYEC